MGKAYSAEQRAHVRELLEAGRDDEAIEKASGVSDRTIRRWKLELERTGRIGKPPESRTGRHRVLQPEVEAALFEYTKDKPEMSVDDMLWWLYDTYKIVVGTRTIRRVFERKGGDKGKPLGGKKRTSQQAGMDGEEEEEDEEQDTEGDLSTAAHIQAEYHSPYAPVPPPTSGSSEIENQLRQAMQQETPQHPYPALMDLDSELPDDEETIQLQLEQIALQKRENELRLKMRILQSNKSTPTGQKSALTTPQSATSPLFNPNASLAPSPPKRDSRSKKKIEESRRRTAERQERMLRELERRSRRRDHLTAEWVQSKDIWPLRAQGLLADLMHQYGCYTYNQSNDATFEAIYRALYQLVDLSKGDWDSHIHDEMLRERTKRKMGQLRTKMQKTGEIVGRTDGFPGFQKAEDYTGEQAGATVGDESEIVQDPALHAADAAALQAQAGTSVLQQNEQLHYDAVPPDQQMQPSPMSYPNPIMHHQGPAQYAMMDQHHNMLPYAQMGSQQGLSHQDSMVI